MVKSVIYGTIYNVEKRTTKSGIDYLNIVVSDSVKNDDGSKTPRFYNIPVWATGYTKSVYDNLITADINTFKNVGNECDTAEVEVSIHAVKNYKTGEPELTYDFQGIEIKRKMKVKENEL